MKIKGIRSINLIPWVWILIAVAFLFANEPGATIGCLIMGKLYYED